MQAGVFTFVRARLPEIKHQRGDRHQAEGGHPGTLGHQPVPGPVSGPPPDP